MKKPLILVVDDDKELLKHLESKIKRWGFDCLTANDGIEALNYFKNNNSIDLVLTDQQMPKMDGLTLLKEIKSKHGDIPFVMLTAYGTVDKAVLSIKHGADDYLQKPYDPDNLLTTIKRSLSYHRLNEENIKLKSAVRDRYSFQNIVTRSEKMIKVLELAKKVAESPDATVLIYGESGTGKEVLAKAIHYESERVGSNFVAINCAGIPSNLLESELYGHVKGAFTGADKDREGKFDLAQSGTILLDEIGDMPIGLQAKLLRTLQEKTYEKVGSNKSIKTDFRFISATHKNLQEMIHKGTFREDLYHRINFYPISIPPLNERKEDIPLLAEYFLDKFSVEFNKKIKEISKKAEVALISYSWPGNIRELHNCIGRAVIVTEGDSIQPNHLIITKADYSISMNMIRFDILLPENEVSMGSITDAAMNIALKRFDNNKTKAAAFLKLDRKAFSRRML